MVLQDRHEAPAIEKPIRMMYSIDRHADLGPGGEPDAHDRDDEHDEGHAGVDADIAPTLSAELAEDREHRRAEDDDLGDRADDVANNHQPAGQEAEVRIDGPPDPLERRAAVSVPRDSADGRNWR